MVSCIRTRSEYQFKTPEEAEVTSFHNTVTGHELNRLHTTERL